STDEASKKSSHASKLGPDGLLVVTPYYNKPTQKGIYEHYKTVAAHAEGCGLILYNVPGRTGCNMLPETVEKLSHIENVMAVKEASANLTQISEIYITACATSKKGFTLLSGDDGLTLPILSVGGAGVISVTSNIVPGLVKKCVNDFMAGDTVSARETHDRLFELNGILFVESNPIPVKTAAALMGLCREEFRLPLCEMADQNRRKLAECLKKYKLIK
ncbi:MAG TPA: 4-hydroxy-tetrahydrodipicolinate synthase, partial [Candidatus Wallbacteria bacterium]|nr:4-hydroxy-tetrahydrodipicolinate synthase [Candidatus Wallbacteria bacterium]